VDGKLKIVKVFALPCNRILIMLKESVITDKVKSIESSVKYLSNKYFTL